MLIVRHRTGPLAGKEERPAGREPNRVLFGRDAATCDVIFPADAREISRRHFALVRKPSGSWTFDLFGAPFVAVDGEPADLGASVRSGAVIELGRRGGPSFELIIEDEPAADLLQTLPQEEVKGSHAVAGEAARSAARARRLALVGVIAALAIGSGLAGFIYVNGATDRQFAAQLAALREQQAKLVADSIPREYRERVARAAHYVIVRDASGRERWAGTAFPIAPDMLATNAHVAINRDDLEPGGKLLVRAPGRSGKTWEVIEHRLHPGYRALEAFLQEDPLLVETMKSPDNPFGAQVLSSANSYDVALMRVSGPPLSPVLEVARPDEILKLSAGDPLAYAGYPSQNIVGSEVQRLGPTPQVRTGAVTAMTDLFTMPAEPAFRRLVHHNLGTTVGTSGSPIIGASGRVVALHNRSNYISTASGVPIPVGVVAFAQRADLLADLISGRAETTLDAERAYWTKQTALMRRGADVIVPAVLAANRPPDGGTAVPATRGRFTLAAGDRSKSVNEKGEEEAHRRKHHSFKVARGSHHLFFAYASRATPITLYLSLNGSIVTKRDSDRWYPAIPFVATADQSVDIFVVGPDEDVTYTLTDYVWDGPKS